MVNTFSEQEPRFGKVTTFGASWVLLCRMPYCHAVFELMSNVKRSSNQMSQRKPNSKSV